MANFLDKLKIKQAVENTTKLDLSCDHITTANFMQFNVAWCKELVPKEKISVNMETFTRLQPMPVPTFGRARINNRAFFVPFRTVFPGWNDFITDTKHTLSNGTSAIVGCPTIDSREIARFFRISYAYIAGHLDVSQEVPNYEDADLTIITDNKGDYTDPIKEYRKLLSGGRYAKKVLESLGYKIIPYDIEEAQSLGFQDTIVKYSALPILCLAKVYCDWFYPSAYANDATFSKVDALFKKDDISRLELTAGDLYDIFDLIYRVNYDSDYFVSAWDNPVNPNDGAYTSLTFNDPGVLGPYVTTGNGPAADEPLLLGAGSNGISQWALDALKSLTDYMKRHQLVGARALDRYLARFGVGLTPEKLRRSVYIGTATADIQFGDVMSTADTEGASLGNYAGKGLGYGQGNFDYDTDEYGMMIIINSILPKTGYYQGVNRNVLHVNRTDYWTPEFDNLGTQAIAKMELFVPQNNAWFTSVSPEEHDEFELASQGGYVNEVFGWTPRYAEYKIGRDMLTGDMNVPTMSTGLSSWHTLREIVPSSPMEMVHNAAFVKGTDSDQYARIFYNTNAEVADKFNVIHHFDVASWSPMKALFDTYEFDSKGKDITLDANGVKMN